MKAISWMFVATALLSPFSARAVFESPLTVPSLVSWKATHVGILKRGSAVTVVKLEEKKADFVILPIHDDKSNVPAPERKLYRLVFRDDASDAVVVSLYKTNKNQDDSVALQAGNSSAFSIKVNGRNGDSLLVEMERINSGTVEDRASFYLDPVMTLNSDTNSL